MKTLIQAVALAVAVAAPIASFARSNEPVTRAQVRAEIVQLAQVGYHVGDSDNVHYPKAVQAAEARVAAANGNTGYGGVANGTSQVGSAAPRVSARDWNAMYGHQAMCAPSARRIASRWRAKKNRPARVGFFIPRFCRVASFSDSSEIRSRRLQTPRRCRCSQSAVSRTDSSGTENPHRR